MEQDYRMEKDYRIYRIFLSDIPFIGERGMEDGESFSIMFAIVDKSDRRSASLPSCCNNSNGVKYSLS